MFTPRRVRLIFCLFLLTAAAIALARIALAVTTDERQQIDGHCRQPSFVFAESFDDVTPPALPSGWSSTTWVTSNSGGPTPPADTPPNAAFVDDPGTISDKQLLSPNVAIVCDAGAVLSFRNNFNLQNGFDGGVLEVSFDHGLTFQDIVAAGGVFLRGGYNGTVSACCGNPLAGRQAWTGSSRGFLHTAVALVGFSCSNFVLRWRLGSDSNVSGEGWRIDSVAISQCPGFRPPPPTPHPRPTPPWRD